jgi:hypothetical protein
VNDWQFVTTNDFLKLDHTCPLYVCRWQYRTDMITDRKPTTSQAHNITELANILGDVGLSCFYRAQNIRVATIGVIFTIRFYISTSVTVG